MNPLTCTTALIALLSCALPAQGPLFAPSLPVYRVGEVAGHLGSARIADGLNAALNSPGDTFQFQVEATISAALVALFNVGAQQRLEVEVKRTTAGYEAQITQTSAQTMGIEAYQNLEINASRGFGKSVLFDFSSTANAATAIEAMALAKALGVQSNLPTARSLLSSMLALVSEAEARISDLGTLLSDAIAQESWRAAVLATARNAFDAASRALDTARNELDDALDEVARLEDLIELLPGWAQGPTRAALSEALDILDDARDVFAAAQSRYSLRFDALRAAESALQAIASTVRSLNADLQTWADRLTDRRRDRDAAQSTLSLFTTPRDIIARHLAGVEFKVYTGADLSAVLSAPGLSLANVGLGFQQSSKFGAKVRLMFAGHGASMRRVIVAGFAELDSTLRAGAMGAGLVGSVKSALEIQAIFPMTGAVPTWQGTRLVTVPSFGTPFVDVRTKLDLAVSTQVGAGIAAAHGVGRVLEVAIDPTTWRNLVQTTPQLVMQPSLDGLLDALGGARVLVSGQDRWIAGGVMQIGGSVLGYGFQFSGHALWNDAGTQSVMAIDAHKFASTFFDPPAIERQLGEMAAVVARLP